MKIKVSEDIKLSNQSILRLAHSVGIVRISHKAIQLAAIIFNDNVKKINEINEEDNIEKSNIQQVFIKKLNVPESIDYYSSKTHQLFSNKTRFKQILNQYKKLENFNNIENIQLKLEEELRQLIKKAYYISLYNKHKTLNIIEIKTIIKIKNDINYNMERRD